MKIFFNAVYTVMYIFAASQLLPLSSNEEVQPNCCEEGENGVEKTFPIRRYHSDYEDSYIQDENFEREGDRPGSRYDIFMEGFMR